MTAESDLRRYREQAVQIRGQIGKASATVAEKRKKAAAAVTEFFAKQWTQAELDALFSKKMATGENLILPIWHRVTKDQVQAQSPLVAGILALNTSLMTPGDPEGQGRRGCTGAPVWRRPPFIRSRSLRFPAFLGLQDPRPQRSLTSTNGSQIRHPDRLSRSPQQAARMLRMSVAERTQLAP